MTSPLGQLIERCTGTDGVHATDVPGLTLHRWSEPQQPCACIACASLCLIAQGRKQVLLGDEVYHYDPQQFLLVSADVPISAHITAATPEQPYLSLSIQLDCVTVSDLAAQVEAHDYGGPVSAIAVSPVEDPLLDAVTRLVALVESPRDRAVLAPLVLREICYRLLTGAQGSRLRKMVLGEGSSQRILHALRWLRAHFAEPVRIEDLAREVKLSPSALHQHFKSVTAMSPLQYQKQLRLHEAHRLMLGEGLDASEASFRVGYESPSQFSREYRRLFGAPPRQHVVHTRAARSDGVLADVS